MCNKENTRAKTKDNDFSLGFLALPVCRTSSLLAHVPTRELTEFLPHNVTAARLEMDFQRSLMLSLFIRATEIHYGFDC